MTEINYRYSILKPVIVSIIVDGQDTQEYLIDPGNGQFSFDGSDIIFHQKGKEFVTLNENSFIDKMLSTGHLGR